MEFNLMLILRGVQALFAIIVLGLTGHVESEIWLGYQSGEIRFLIFCSVWTFFIVVPYFLFAPVYLPQATHKFALLGADIVTTVFWFAGFIALAADMPPARYCDLSSLCGEMQAAVVFSSFEFVAFAATSVLTFLRLREQKPQVTVAA